MKPITLKRISRLPATWALPDEEWEEFRTALRDFIRLYSFLAHVVPVASPDMERIYLYGRVLLPRLTGEDEDGLVDLSGTAVLTHLRIERNEFSAASFEHMPASAVQHRFVAALQDARKLARR